MKVSALITRKTVAIGILIVIVLAAVVYVWWTSHPSATPVIVVDDIGRNVVIDEPPKRIVSMAPGITEILFALGLGNKVVGNTYVCDYPPEALEIEKVSEIISTANYSGGAYQTFQIEEFHIEKIVELRPDLVLMERSFEKVFFDMFPKIEKANLNVVVLWARNFEGALHDIKLIGEITWSQNNAKKLISTMERRVKAVSDKVRGHDKPRVFSTIWYDGKYDPFTFGYGNHKPPFFLDEIIKMAGGINMAGNNYGTFQMALEAVVQANPQIILVIEDPRFPTPTYDAIMGEERLKNTEAIQNNAVYKIDMRVVVRAGPRLVDAIEGTAKIFHSELFG